MKIQPYLRPRLVGPRFEDHAIPLEFLRNLSVLDEMVVEVAKWRYLEAHPERKRSPRGFADGITLTLTDVEEGSVVPVIALLFGSLLPPNQRYFDEAKEAIVGAIRAAANNKSPTDYLPEKSLAYFDRFGRSLRDREAIEFPSADGDAPIRLTKEVRRRLLLASTRVTELTEEIELQGAIHEANQETMSFQVTLADGSKISGPIASQHFENIMEVFNGYRQRVKILLQGVGKFNRLEKLQRIESIEHTTVLDPQDIQAHFEELRTLKDGWLDGQRETPSHEGLEWLSTLLDTDYPDNLTLPYVYPVAEGGVQRRSIWVQTVWLQPKLDRLPSFFKESGFFLDSARPVDPRKHALFDLMEETPMIGIPMRDWDGRSVSPRSISGSLVNEAICVGIISRTTSNSNHYFGAQPNGLHPIDFANKLGDWHILNLETNEEESKSLNLSNNETWKWVFDRLIEMRGASPSD